MPFLKGAKHTPEAKAKMRFAREGVPHSEERKAKIAAANQGQIRQPIFERVCPCGVAFVSAARNAVFHSRECRRASQGHGLRHLPAFAHLPAECEICGGGQQLVGDHDHASGRPRGLLCRTCNLAIGNMFDDPARLRAAAAYLDRVRARRSVYLCGPMSGLPAQNYPTFHAAARQLRLAGAHVENPAENRPPMCGSWAAFMRLSIAQLVNCESVALLPGWNDSRGASLEVHIAEALGMTCKPVEAWLVAVGA